MTIETVYLTREARDRAEAEHTCYGAIFLGHSRGQARRECVACQVAHARLERVYR